MERVRTDTIGCFHTRVLYERTERGGEKDMGQQTFQHRSVLLLGTCLVLITILTAGCVFVSTKGLRSRDTLPFEERVLFGKGRDKILLLAINGLISEEESSKLLQLQAEPSMVSLVKEQLDKASRDARVKGILLMINSPGGTVTASDIIYNEIRRFKAEKQVKVAALLNGTATSGAYYVAQGADLIIAHPTAVTGSIGVILMNLNLNGLMEKIGVSNETVKSGMYKDLGSPFRKPEEGEAEILQGVVDELHGRFVRVVEDNRRNLKFADRPELVDGRIFTARQALSEGLIDRIGYVSDAVDWVRDAAAVPDARVVRYKRRGDYRPNIYSYGREQGFQAEFNLIKLDLEGLLSACGPTFMYLWMPGM
jgi:protease-4